MVGQEGQHTSHLKTWISDRISHELTDMERWVTFGSTGFLLIRKVGIS